MTQIETKLIKFRRRVRILRAWRGVAIGGTIGAAAAAVWATLDFFRIFYAEWIWLVVLVGACAMVGALIGFFGKIAPESLAQSIDRRAKLEDRLSTAIECASADSSFTEIQHQDATQRIQQLKPSRLYPVRLSRWHAAFMTVCVVAASLFLLGNSPLLMSDQQKKDRKDLQDVASAVERVAKPLLDEKDKNADEKKLAQDLERYREELKRGRMSKEEALQKADELSQQAQKLSEKRFEQSEQQLQTAQDALDKLDKAALDQNGFKDIDPALLSKSSEENMQQADALSQELQKMQQEMQSGKGDDGHKLSASELAALKDRMSALQKELQAIKLSEKARQFLDRLHSQPEWKKLMEIMKEAQKLAKNGKAGHPQLTAEQVKQMIKELEKLADRLKSDKDMQEFIKQLEAALKSGCFG